MIVKTFRVTWFTIECIGDGSRLATGMPLRALPIDFAAVHIVPDILVTHEMQQFISAQRCLIQDRTVVFELLDTLFFDSPRCGVWLGRHYQIRNCNENNRNQERERERKKNELKRWNHIKLWLQSNNRESRCSTTTTKNWGKRPIELYYNEMTLLVFVFYHVQIGEIFNSRRHLFIDRSRLFFWARMIVDKRLIHNFIAIHELLCYNACATASCALEYTSWMNRN